MFDESNNNPHTVSDANKIDIGSVEDVSGEVNVAGGHVIHAQAGATVIVGIPSSPAPAQVGAGLQALRELMERSTQVRIAMNAFRTDFGAASVQVGLLGDYKDLHDLLHLLQFSCYNGIVLTAARFPGDDSALENLYDYHLSLENIYNEMRVVVDRELVPKIETTWIQEIAEALRELQIAIDQLDEQSLKKVIWRLNRLLSVQPTRINTRLNSAARNLRLSSLVLALRRVYDHILTLDLDRGKVEAFKTGLEALVNLCERLDRLIEDHEQWQAVDIELRRIEALIGQDLLELEMSWSDLHRQAGPLFESRTEVWAEAFQKESKALDEALAFDNPIKTRRAFRSFRRRAGDRFYRVDLELKALCGELRLVGDPIASILRILE